MNGVPGVYGYNLMYGMPKRMEGAVHDKIKVCGDGAQHCPGAGKYVNAYDGPFVQIFFQKKIFVLTGTPQKIWALERGGVFNNPLSMKFGNDCTLLQRRESIREACVQNSE